MDKEQFLEKLHLLKINRKRLYVELVGFVRQRNVYGCFYDGNKWIVYKTDNNKEPHTLLESMTEREAFFFLFETLATVK